MSSSQGYYDRAVPYGYYEPSRHERGSDNQRRSTRTIIHENEQETQDGRVRRRIAVACSRCRKRKIRCSGDTGYGGGCQACRQSGHDATRTCTFMRVNSTEMPINADSCPPETIPMPSSHEVSTTHAVEQLPLNKTSRRPSLPTLQTRTNPSNAWEHEHHYDGSLADHYGYSSTAVRQDSVASTAGTGSARLWQTTTDQTQPSTTSYYDQPMLSYSFGNLQYPSYTSSASARLPSVTSDNWSSWNMNSLHWSLPPQTASERRLPVPNPTYGSISQAPLTEGPSIRPIGMESSIHINGIHSRNAMPWSADMHRPSISRSASVSNYPTHGLPLPNTQPPISESTFGYQFPAQLPNINGTNSETSPTTETHQHMLPPAPPNFRYLTQPRTPITTPNTSRRQSSSANLPLYSFSSAETEIGQPRGRRGSDGSSSTSPESIGQPHPQSQQQRVSLANLNGQY